MNRPGKWRWIVPAALVVALALSGSVLAAPLGQITEFPTATVAAGPEGVVSGPDGNLWFPEANADKIGEVNPTTGTTADFPVPTAGSVPVGIALGPDGNLWFTEFVGNKIGEINPVTHAITEFALPNAGSGPVAIVAGPNGNLWFTESADPGRVGEISPTTHAITEFPAATSGVVPFGIAVGPDGDLWYTEKDVHGPTIGTNSRIAWINPNTGTGGDVATPTGSSAPNAIAAGPNGSLWFTESAPSVSKIGLINVAAHTIPPEIPTATAMSAPTVIAPGADGNMWFTEGDASQIAVINSVTHLITNEFPTPTASSSPIGIAAGPDGNLWFTEGALPGSKIGRAGAGAPAAAVAAPAVTGTPQPGQTLTCQAATWSSWAGQQPGFGFGFDGFRWLLDGSQIAGATAQTLTVPAADAGHTISCQEIATYPLVAATVSSASAAVTISPSLGASLVNTQTTPTTVTLTLSCQGLPTQRCTGTATLTAHVTTQGKKIVAVAAKAKQKKPKPKPKPPKKVTKVETIASGSYSIPTGTNSTVTLRLNAAGKKALTARYKVPATLTLTGTAAARKTETLKYGVIKLSPSYTWAFGKSFSFATELTVTHLPKGSKVLLACHGHGCPFAKKTFSAPKSGKLALASALKKRHLSPDSTVTVQITAPNEVGEVVVFTIVSGKSPKEAFRCLPPGTRTPVACAA
jgi:streptogramin lyase